MRASVLFIALAIVMTLIVLIRVILTNDFTIDGLSAVVALFVFLSWLAYLLESRKNPHSFPKGIHNV